MSFTIEQVLAVCQEVKEIVPEGIDFWISDDYDKSAFVAFSLESCQMGTGYMSYDVPIITGDSVDYKFGFQAKTTFASNVIISKLFNP